MLHILNKFISRAHRALQGDSRAFSKLSQMPGNHVQAGCLLFAICGLAVAISYPLGGTHIAGGQVVLILFVVASPFFVFFGMKVSQLHGYTSQKKLVGYILCILAVVLIILLAIPHIGQELLPKSVWNVFMCCTAVLPCVVLYWGVINYLVRFRRERERIRGVTSSDSDGPFSLGSALCCICVAVPFFVIVPVLVASDAESDTKARLLAGTVFFVIMTITTGLVVIVAGSMQTNQHENELKVRVHMVRAAIRPTCIRAEVARSIVDKPLICDRTHETGRLMCKACEPEVQNWLLKGDFSNTDYDPENDMSLDPDDDHLACMEEEGVFWVALRAKAAGIVIAAEQQEEDVGCCLPCTGCCSQEQLESQLGPATSFLSGSWFTKNEDDQPKEPVSSDVESKVTDEQHEFVTVPKHMLQIACNYGKRTPGRLTVDEVRSFLVDIGLNICARLPDTVLYAISQGAMTPVTYINQMHPDWDKGMQSIKLCRELQLKEMQDLAGIDLETHREALCALGIYDEAVVLERELFGIQWKILNIGELELDFHEFMGFLHNLSELLSQPSSQLSLCQTMAGATDLPYTAPVPSLFDCKVEVLPLDRSDLAEVRRREELAYDIVQVCNHLVLTGDTDLCVADVSHE